MTRAAAAPARALARPARRIQSTQQFVGLCCLRARVRPTPSRRGEQIELPPFISRPNSTTTAGGFKKQRYTTNPPPKPDITEVLHKFLSVASFSGVCVCGGGCLSLSLSFFQVTVFLIPGLGPRATAATHTPCLPGACLPGAPLSRLVSVIEVPLVNFHRRREVSGVVGEEGVDWELGVLGRHICSKGGLRDVVTYYLLEERNRSSENNSGGRAPHMQSCRLGTNAADSSGRSHGQRRLRKAPMGARATSGNRRSPSNGGSGGGNATFPVTNRNLQIESEGEGAREREGEPRTNERRR